MFSLLRRRDFALVWTASLISATGDWVLFIGLPIYVFQLTGSTLATSAMFVAELVPQIAFGSVAGVFVDRWDRKRTMVAANLILTFAILPLAFVRSADDVWIVYFVAFTESLVARFLRPAEGAMLPRLVDQRDLVAANALGSFASNTSRLGGARSHLGRSGTRGDPGRSRGCCRPVPRVLARVDRRPRARHALAHDPRPLRARGTVGARRGNDVGPLRGVGEPRHRRHRA
ncbi:MAG: MFS transporter [Chloroflexi bacterium]|nr:MAG: MFS transporter [Chloroflexota bacterium]